MVKGIERAKWCRGIRRALYWVLTPILDTLEDKFHRNVTYSEQMSDYTQNVFPVTKKDRQAEVREGKLPGVRIPNGSQ